MAQTTAKTEKGGDASTPTKVISRQVRETRDRRGWNAQQLADRCAEAGMPTLDRSTIANIESGRRRRIGADELLVLAYVLDVAPVHLLVPRDDEDPFEVVPNAEVKAAQARRWIRGTDQLLGLNEKVFRTEVPESEWEGRKARVEEAQEAYLRAERQLRVAKAMLDTISDDYGNMDPPKLLSAVGSIGSQRDDTERRKMMERKLSAAYERVAEAAVEMQDAKSRFVRARSEERVD
jgi:transcriptional regulator with XRE-family HTH domain